MSPILATAIASALQALFTIWQTQAGKPDGWTPTQQDIDDLLALSSKEPDDYKKEAAARLGLPWPLGREQTQQKIPPR